ncbi:MAG: alpha/beta fold hydrolase [Betaproteobacteria bacterium]|nr:alpha/beta fold hydrolase [Betaproteobacteria bacterium]
MMPADGERIVLVHGLWMNGLAMLPLARRLERCGFAVTRHGYQSVRRGLRENARRLASVCEKSGAPLNLVGHSLGGLLIMTMLHNHPQVKAHRVVLVGSPYANSVAAQGMARFAASRGLLGRTLQDWLRQPRPPIPDGVELGAIAGDVSIGLGRLFAHLPRPNDGVVILDETHVPGAADSIVLHTSHSAMLVSPAVARAACAFLKNGRFGQ